MNRLTPVEARQKIYRYCAYQDVKNKLYEFGLRTDDVNEILSHLITENFLNEERFARAFAGGKFRMKKWGRLKIVQELKKKGITANCIKLGLREIDEGNYYQTLKFILEKKLAAVENDNEFVKNDKAAKYAIQKGFEPELVWEILKAR
jgi:regulatory protein